MWTEPLAEAPAREAPRQHHCLTHQRSYWMDGWMTSSMGQSIPRPLGSRGGGQHMGGRGNMAGPMSMYVQLWGWR